MPDWKDPTTIERLLAAVIASNGCKVDNMAVARFFNDTYDAVENKCRVYKKQAQALVKEAEDDGRMEMNMRKKTGTTTAPKGRTPKKAATPDLTSVKSGRVTKTPKTPKTPSKKKVKKIVSDNESDDELAHTTDAGDGEEV